MFGIPFPYLIIGLILSLSGTYFYGHHTGYAEKEAEDAAEIVRINTQMNSDKEKADATLHNVKSVLKAQNDQLIAAVRDGAMRLSIPVSTPAGHSPFPSRNAEERAELDGQTSEALIAITNDGDKAIIDLNSCIDRYQAIREAARGNR